MTKIQKCLSSDIKGSPRDIESGSGFGHLHSLGWDRKIERESRAPSVVGRGPQTATMRLNDRTADRQAHAGALGFGRKECIEDLVRLLGRQAHAGIAN